MGWVQALHRLLAAEWIYLNLLGSMDVNNLVSVLFVKLLKVMCNRGNRDGEVLLVLINFI